MNDFMFVAGIVAGSLAFAGLIAFGVVSLLRFLANQPGGLGHLARTYPMKGAEPEPTLTRQTLKIGAVTYKNIGKLTIGRDALCVRVWGQSAEIPWSEIKGVGHTTFRWQTWPVLHVGSPQVAGIVISPAAYQAMKGRIGGDA